MRTGRWIDSFVTRYAAERISDFNRRLLDIQITLGLQMNNDYISLVWSLFSKKYENEQKYKNEQKSFAKNIFYTRILKRNLKQICKLFTFALREND